MTYTHEIVAVQRRETKNGKIPMWVCTTQDNHKVYVFQHNDREKNTFHLFETAGYGEVLLKMEVGDRYDWTDWPIVVEMAKEGDWWLVCGVQLRPAAAEPDVLFEPDVPLWRQAVGQWAYRLIHPLGETARPLYWDTETTGTGHSAEIISIGLINWEGKPCFESLIQPARQVQLASDVHGITEDRLAGAPTFVEIYDTLQSHLSGNPWVLYNAAFDVRLLEQTCLRYGLPPIFSGGTHCAMEMFARWQGAWQVERQQFTYQSLAQAAEVLGIENAKAHDALADALTTWKVVCALADAS